jgi:uncharacterized membrane protein YraQ (UPF0718 family)
MVAITVLLLAIAFWHGRDLPLAGLFVAWQTIWRNLLILLLGFAMAGLVQVLVPKELISRWLGAQAGLKGMLIACVAGGLMPGSPYAVFPLVAALYRAGAGMGAIVGFITAWSLWSVSRLPLEVAVIGARPALLRYAITFIVPPLAGLLADVMSRFW